MHQISETQRVEANLLLSSAELQESWANHLDAQAKDLEESVDHYRREAQQLRDRAKKILGFA